MTYAIRRADPDAAHEPILQLLLAFNREHADGADGATFALTITDGEDPTVRGGLWAHSLWGSFYVSMIVVAAEARGRGFGLELMRQAEAEARTQGCRQMWLDTFAFQARPFYERLGFEVFGQIDGPAPMFPRYFMQKRLE
jgi:GNAT superfamily N-acetyltransferase